jgi:hypothetical protein
MTDEQIEEIIDKARRTHSGEISFPDWVVWLRTEFKQTEAQKNETPEA